MTFQLLISTMHKTKEEILDMLKKMNVNCDCVIINQCNQNMCYDELINFQKNPKTQRVNIPADKLSFLNSGKRNIYTIEVIM